MLPEDIKEAYTKYGPFVLRRCLRILGNEHAAQEALQETFMRLARRHDAYAASETKLAWLYRVAERCCFDRLSRPKEVPSAPPRLSIVPRHPVPPVQRQAQMRFTYTETTCDPRYYAPLAKAAEAAGFSTFLVPAGVLYPDAQDTRYPLTPIPERRLREPFIEPFSLIPMLAAATEKLRFSTCILELPPLPPVRLAKAVSSMGVLTGNRFSLAIGTGRLIEHNIEPDWATRGPRMAETIAVLRGLLSGKPFEFHGADYDLPSTQIFPVPTEPVPILVGGHEPQAMAHAARFGDGWMHVGFVSMLSMGVMKVQELLEEHGRENDPFEIHASPAMPYSLDGARGLRDHCGVTDLIVGFRNQDPRQTDLQTLGEKIDRMNRFADEVIAKM